MVLWTHSGEACSAEDSQARVILGGGVSNIRPGSAVDPLAEWAAGLATEFVRPSAKWKCRTC